ncbi:MAG: hypothetical protein AAGN35_07595 [Bacteroidota bacterium]
MVSSNDAFIPIAVAHDQSEAIRIRLLLNRARIPYRVIGEHMHNVYGLAGSTLFGPMKFVIPAELREQAERELQNLFDVNLDLPETCPACDSSIPEGVVDCPACGLFLG